jgi:hypothetical protein
MTITAPTKPAPTQSTATEGHVTLTLAETDAVLAAKAALANSSRDDVTPVICGARFRIVRERLEVTATDRYTVSRHRLTPHHVTDEGRLAPTKSGDELDVIVPRAALTWLAKNANAFRRATFGGKVVFDFHPEQREPGLPRVKPVAGHVTITVAPVVGDQESLAATFMLIDGKFPPVEQLIDKAETAEVGVLSLSPRHLAKLNSYIPRDIPARFEFTVSPSNNKPGPIKITVAELDLDGLIQPNLLLR